MSDNDGFLSQGDLNVVISVHIPPVNAEKAREIESQLRFLVDQEAKLLLHYFGETGDGRTGNV